MGMGRYERGKGFLRFCLCTALTAGILGMSAFQVMAWAAPEGFGAANGPKEASAVNGEREQKTAERPEQRRQQEEKRRRQGESGMKAAEGTLRQTPADERTASADTEKENALSPQEQPPLIAIDPGHGGMDCGCMGKLSSEKDLNLQIARALQTALMEKGYRVLLLREKDELQDKLDRVEIANSYQADLYISIHQNTYEGQDKSVGGIETWYDGADAARDNQRLALLVHRETVKSSGARGRSVIDSQDLYVVSKTLMPACLIETGFLSNPQEEALLASSGYQRKLAEGIARGIELYFHPADTYLPFREVSGGFMNLREKN